ncbi:hypothetical protein O0555_11290 [Brevibacillus laterosporus]|uniref:hypothetical protein n=1 Tax=Brevibacillus laterosporus TaxID=1465 RepID=UPI0015E227FE|nr:hypothetical protein [Brevibacillus laterosporus]MCR8937933.1 hypothetical protein [Brevibacillus laterosporus]MCZ0840572.1 hypothetical protein [Brevibacillus laterosporus]MCZ0844649.1 hypothetical protein [Brevibacillus laterosporus]MED1911197.1 hypothetical protein [Brevibacillus laterosporus]
MRTYTFLFETKTNKWEERVEANSMLDAARKAKELAIEKSKALATKIMFSFYHVRAV